MQRLKDWILAHKIETALLVIVLLIASFLRFYKIDEYLPFLGDEGRDVRVVRRFITNFDLMFIGPRTSIGDMYLGPLYYYLISPFLLLWNFSPTGPAVFVALLGIGTVFLLWLVGREWFGKAAGLVSAFLYGISPLVVQYSTHSWNPNIMPFFALLAIFSIWRVWVEDKFFWLVVTGISFGAITQSHYLGLLLAPTIGLFWLLKFISMQGERKLKRKFFIFSLVALLVFFLMTLPLILFDYKHGWHNFSSITTFFTVRQETVSIKPWNAIPLLWPSWRDELVTRFLLAKDKTFSIVIGGALLGLFVWAGYVFKQKRELGKLKAHFLLGLWGLVGLVGLGLIKQNIYDHYYGFMFAVPFLVVGVVSQTLWERKLKWIVILIVIVLGWINLQNSPFKNPPQRQMQATREVARKIIEESRGETFNFGLIAKRNYEEGYLYFLELEKSQIKEIDPQNLCGTLAEQLFVVCEDEVCEPINNPKAEIANFGWAKIENQWDVQGRKLFKLVHQPK